jgi:uncharacterized protein YrrD
MRKGKSVIGKQVLSLATGQRLESVNDLVLDPDVRRMIALVVSEGGILTSSKVVPSSEITSYGKDAVVVRAPDAIISASDQPELRAAVNHNDKILGKAVFTTTGDKLGAVSDVYFDERTADVMGYEVSSGLIGDATKGTSYLATDEITNIGPDVIYVHPLTADALEAQVGGIQGALQGAGDQLGQATQTIAGKVGEAGANAGDGVAVYRAKVSPEDSLVGKLTGSDVETDEGSVIVPKGRRVRPDDIERAREAGKLPVLTSSVAQAAAQEAGARAGDSLGSAGDTATGLWDQFTTKIGEITDATGKRVDEQQTKKRLSDIADAVGRPVTKVILDREDNVILNMGDIITHQAIQRSYDAGGLDSLLDSVYKAKVEFTKEELRSPAGTEAQASVEKASGGAVILEELESKVETAEQERQADQERKKREGAQARTAREREREARAAERAKAAETRGDEDMVAAGPEGQSTGSDGRSSSS